MTTASRWQHTASSTLVLVIAVTVTAISFMQQPAEAFLFSRLISIFFIVLAFWNFVRAVGGKARVGKGLSLHAFGNLLPGLAVMIVYTFFAAKWMGFYFASTLTFLSVYSLYDPSPLSDIRAWFRRIGITLCFMGVIYVLFGLLLKVQPPRGIWF